MSTYHSQCQNIGRIVETQADTDLHIQTNVCECQRGHLGHFHGFFRYSNLEYYIARGLSAGEREAGRKSDSNPVLTGLIGALLAANVFILFIYFLD